jgi:asparagine synthase (glutamine-hydrolysing)
VTAIFGIVALDRAPVELEVVLRMGASLEYRPADASGQYLAHGVALGARALWVTPEAVRQGIPYRDKEAGLVCVADIRLDDRESVIDTLGVAREAPDEAFLCAAYQRWGPMAYARCTGRAPATPCCSRPRRNLCS